MQQRRRRVDWGLRLPTLLRSVGPLSSCRRSRACVFFGINHRITTFRWDIHFCQVVYLLHLGWPSLNNRSLVQTLIQHMYKKNVCVDFRSTLGRSGSLSLFSLCLSLSFFFSWNVRTAHRCLLFFHPRPMCLVLRRRQHFAVPPSFLPPSWSFR